MIIIGIDPGTKESGYVVWDGNKIIDKGIVKNEDLIVNIKLGRFAKYGCELAVEGFQYFGRKFPVGSEVFKTCYFIGRLSEVFGYDVLEEGSHLVYQKDIKIFFCGTVRVKDKDIRKALITRLGKEITKGVTSHMWSALAIAVFFYEIMTEKINLDNKRIN